MGVLFCFVLVIFLFMCMVCMSGMVLEFRYPLFQVVYRFIEFFWFLSKLSTQTFVLI